VSGSLARLPDTFIVGAPKCGTTAMYEFLRQHPDIFMADTKELHYFGSDLERRFTPRLTLEEYAAYFARATKEARVGEASVRYLQSRSAAAEICAFNPVARVIIMLRDPIEMIHAMHAELLFSGMEDIADLGAALAAEADRRAGRRIPAGTNIAEMLQYRDAARYAEQVERYLAAFGRERVHVIVYDDLRSDAAAVVKATYDFLEVDQAFAPRIAVVNPSKSPRSRRLQRLIAEPPTWLRRAGRTIVPRAVRKRAYKRLLRLNAKPAERSPIDPAVRRELAREFAPEVSRLAALLGRELDHWARADDA
jgi:hypothetical protein